eukprot:3439136-Prymnesium_polylepis.1
MAMVERRSSVQDIGSTRRRPAPDAREAVRAVCLLAILEGRCGLTLWKRGSRFCSHTNHDPSTNRTSVFAHRTSVIAGSQLSGLRAAGLGRGFADVSRADISRVSRQASHTRFANVSSDFVLAQRFEPRVARLPAEVASRLPE